MRKMIKQTLKKSCIAVGKRVTNNRYSQSLLENLVKGAQYFQGIGPGSDVSQSGEGTVFTKLKDCVGAEQELCIFDVGANQGQYIALASKCLADRQYRIHSFEPSRRTFQMLSESAAGLSNVVLNNCGLSLESEERELFYDAPGSGIASLTKRNLDHFGVNMELSEKVRMVSIDDYCSDRRIEHIDMLKIDVEGHELDVLKGGEEMFRKLAIGMVTFEFGGCNIDTRTFLHDFFVFFQNHQMRIARITPSGYLCDLHSYREVLEQFRTSNFLCYRG